MSHQSLNFCLLCFLSSNPFLSVSNLLLINWNPLYQASTAVRLEVWLYPSNNQQLFHKDLTWFIQSLSQVHQNQASERKALLAGCKRVKRDNDIKDDLQETGEDNSEWSPMHRVDIPDHIQQQIKILLLFQGEDSLDLHQTRMMVCSSSL